MSLSAQPGSASAVIDEAVANAVESQRIRGGHFYAKCSVEPRWVSAWFNSHPNLRHEGSDDKPRWYDFGRNKPPRGFWFDIATGSDLGPVSKLDKRMVAAMRRALVTPQQAPVGLDGDTVTYCLVENVKCDTARFNLWFDSQRTISVPWLHRSADGSVSMAFITAEQENRFRRKNLQDLCDQFQQSIRRSLAPYLVDFNWYSKNNFLLETNGVVLSGKGFSSEDAEGIHCLWVKRYDQLYVWENGFLRGVYNLSSLPDLNSSWRDIKQSARNIRAIPFSNKEYRAILDHYEDSIYLLHLTALNIYGQPDTALLKQYFDIYGKYDARHSADIENSIFLMAKSQMEWGVYYLHTYNRRRGTYWGEIDDLSFSIVQRDFSQAQTYKKLFPKGKHLAEIDEILAYETACQAYDRNLYLSQYPNGAYLQRFDLFMESEEQRLFRVAEEIYSQSTPEDIDETMRTAIDPYMRYFPNGEHFDEVEEMYYYGVAYQKRSPKVYGSHYSLKTERGMRLRRLIDQRMALTVEN